MGRYNEKAGSGRVLGECHGVAEGSEALGVMPQEAVRARHTLRVEITLQRSLYGTRRELADRREARCGGARNAHPCTTPVTHSLRQHRPKLTRALSSRLNGPVRSPEVRPKHSPEQLR